MTAKKTLRLNGIEVRVEDTPLGEFLCLTDLAKVVGDKTGKIIGNWLTLIGTIEFLKEWEARYNAEGFNVLGYQDIRMQAGTLRFSMSAQKWIEATGARGIFSDAGRYGGTFAHNAIALEFCAAISPAFKLGVYSDYLELKSQSARRWLDHYSFFLQKIEDNALENTRLAADLREEIKKLND